MSISLQALIILLAVSGYLVAPITIIWGWVRFANHEAPKRVLPILTLSGFALSSASAALALGSIIFAQFHDFPSYDPLLKKILRAGLLLSFGAFLLGLMGIWKPSTLRWHTPISAVATAAFWLMAAAAE